LAKVTKVKSTEYPKMGNQKDGVGWIRFFGV